MIAGQSQPRKGAVIWFVLATWLLFAVTLAPDDRIRTVVAFEGWDVPTVLWILSCAAGLAAGVAGLFGWARWPLLALLAAAGLVFAGIVYWYELMGVLMTGEQEKGIGTAFARFWQSLGHGLRVGAWLTVYREILMPLIQVVVIAVVLLRSRPAPAQA